MLLSNGLWVLENTFIFILMSSFLLKVDGNQASGNCTYTDKEHKCCNNYYYVNGTCSQCPKGTFGDNCSALCPDNMYGDLCVKRCKCEKNQVCNRVHGCIECPKGTFGDNCSAQCPDNMYGDLCVEKCKCEKNQVCNRVHGCIGNNAPGNCTNSNRINECCTNYFYVGGACIKCAKGTFGINCSEQCPKNMYGDLCAEKCDCKVYEQCHHEHGCIDSRGICGNTSYEMICCKNYILKDGYCKESKSHLKTTGLIYWIIPVICGIVIFIFICIYRRSQPKKQRQFVDIPVYQHEMHGNTRDNYDHMADINIIMAQNGKTFVDRKLEATSSASMTREVGTPDEIKDTGEYHTLNLRVFDYEEPIKHEQLKRSQSENSSLYFDNNVSNWRRGSSLRHIRSTNDHIHESDEQKLRERHFVPENYVSKSVNNSEPTFDDFDLNNPTTLERKNMVPPSQLFLNELSSHLFNLQKH